jgi:predicted ester cyclase
MDPTRQPAPDDVRSRFRVVFDVISAGDLDRLATVVHQDVVDHQRILGQGDGLPGLTYWARMLRELLPDLTARVEDTVVEGRKVAGRVRFTGTLADTARLAPAPVDPWIEFELFVIVAFEDGLVVEWWDASDTVQLLRDLGVEFTAPRP